MPFQAATLLLYPDLLVVCLCATLISHATLATARKNKAELLSIFRLYTTANHLTHNVFVELPEQRQQTVGEPSVLPCCSYLLAFVPKGVTCCGCLLRAAAQTPSLVCRPSSRALRLQVPLPSPTRAPRLSFLSISPRARRRGFSFGLHA
jgi:hypothetical protein